MQGATRNLPEVFRHRYGSHERPGRFDRLKESFDRASFMLPVGYAFRNHPVFNPVIRGPTFSRGRQARYVGSGNVGHSYLFSIDGLLQAPVSYYSRPAKWDLSPGYQTKKTIDLTRAVEPACLQCHASRLQPIAATQNRFESLPFLEAGIGCERCHGPGKTHIDLMTSGTRNQQRGIVNPARLDAARRDSVCAQCHLTGAARIARAGRSSATYRPGDLLSDHLAVFVWGGGSSHMTATSHCWHRGPGRPAETACGVEVVTTRTINRDRRNERPFSEPCLSCHQSSAWGESAPSRKAFDTAPAAICPRARHATWNTSRSRTTPFRAGRLPSRDAR